MDRMSLHYARLIHAFPDRDRLEPAPRRARGPGPKRLLHQRDWPDDSVLVLAPLKAEILELGRMPAVGLWDGWDRQQLLHHRMHRAAVEYQAHPDLIDADGRTGRVANGLRGSGCVTVKVGARAALSVPVMIQFDEVFLDQIGSSPPHDLVDVDQVSGAGQQFIKLLGAAVPDGRDCECDAHL